MHSGVARGLRNFSNGVEKRGFHARVLTTIENYLIKFWISNLARPSLLKDSEVAQMLDASRRNASVESLESYARASPVTTEVEASRSSSPVAELLIVSCLKNSSIRRTRRVRFNPEVQVMLIPARSDYLKSDLKTVVWWNLTELKKSFVSLTSPNESSSSTMMLVD